MQCHVEYPIIFISRVSRERERQFIKQFINLAKVNIVVFATDFSSIISEQKNRRLSRER